jgi:hypothetical protein
VYDQVGAVQTHDLEALQAARMAAENVDVLRDSEFRVVYLPEPDTYYVWTEGQEFTAIEVRKYEKNSFNLLGFDWDDLVSDNSFVWQQVEYTDQKPMLESESLIAIADIPQSVKDQLYALDYITIENEKVRLITGVSQVRDVATNRVYIYKGPNNEATLLPQADFSDTELWEYSTTVTDKFQNVNAERFDNTFVNYIFVSENWTTGGGWLRKKTVHTKTTTTLYKVFPYVATPRSGWGTWFSVVPAVAPKFNS